MVILKAIFFKYFTYLQFTRNIFQAANYFRNRANIDIFRHEALCFMLLSQFSSLNWKCQMDRSSAMHSLIRAYSFLILLLNMLWVTFDATLPQQQLKVGPHNYTILKWNIAQTISLAAAESLDCHDKKTSTPNTFANLAKYHNPEHLCN